MAPADQRRDVWLTRPEEDAAAMAAAVEALGYRALVEPLLQIVAKPAAPLELAGVQALALSSRHALPALPPAARGLPVFAVGQATAAAARAAGCQQVLPAAGDAQALAALIIARCRPAAGAILHLAGQDVRPGLAEALAEAGFALRRVTVYEAVAAQALSPALIARWRARKIAAVLLFSPRTARILVDLLQAHGLHSSVDTARAICLSESVAASCRTLAWRALEIAARPDREAMLALLGTANESNDDRLP